jgi:hypothetical protein
MFLRTVPIKIRLLAVVLLLVGSSLDAGAGSFCLPSASLSSANQAAAVNPQVGPSDLTISLQLFRSKSEQAPLSQICSDKDAPFRSDWTLRGSAGPCTLNGWRTAPSKPLCEQALHQRTGVFLS